MRLGRNFAKTFVDYYELNGCVNELIAERAAAVAMRRKTGREREGEKGRKQTNDRINNKGETNGIECNTTSWNNNKQNYEG